MDHKIKQLLEAVRDETLSVDDALLQLKMEPFADLGYAKPDFHRQLRQRIPEVIYGAGKTPDQIAGILQALRQNGQEQVLVTRLSADAFEKLKGLLSEKDAGETVYYETARIALTGGMREADGIGKIVVATGGTSDLPVAEEAAIVAEAFGNKVVRLYDVGVAGLHRLLAHQKEIMTAAVVIAVAGMEGALASVIGGLAACPVIAVPSSVGYGASFGGLSALLSMLNSCAGGVSVVNIDNGFGAGYLADRINHIDEKQQAVFEDGGSEER